jgi:acyl dehydratase
VAGVTGGAAAETTVLDEATLALVGVAGPRRWTEHPVELGEIRRFVQAAMEVDPIHVDEAAARARGFAGIVAPPLFPLHAFRRSLGSPDPFETGCQDPDWDGIDIVEDDLPPLRLPLERLLNGGVEAQVFRYAQVGDIIGARSRYDEISERKGRTGPMVFVVVETDYVDQDGDLLLVTRTTMIAR